MKDNERIIDDDKLVNKFQNHSVGPRCYSYLAIQDFPSYKDTTTQE